jgi:hypothetical protein
MADMVIAAAIAGTTEAILPHRAALAATVAVPRTMAEDPAPAGVVAAAMEAEAEATARVAEVATAAVVEVTAAEAVATAVVAATVEVIGKFISSSSRSSW